jgi:hypothetical protein
LSNKPRPLYSLALICMGLLMLATPVFGQRVYSELEADTDIEVFTEVSDGLICQCGCRMVLSSCPHVECPWGIPARRFTENRIREGWDSDRILNGFVNGFGDVVDTDPVALRLQAAGRADFVGKLRNGFGEEIRARTGHLVPALIVTAFTVLMFWLGLLWWRRNRTTETTAESKPEATEASPLDEKVRGRIEDLDR